MKLLRKTPTTSDLLFSKFSVLPVTSSALPSHLAMFSHLLYFCLFFCLLPLLCVFPSTFIALTFPLYLFVLHFFPCFSIFGPPIPVMTSLLLPVSPEPGVLLPLSFPSPSPAPFLSFALA